MFDRKGWTTSCAYSPNPWLEQVPLAKATWRLHAATRGAICQSRRRTWCAKNCCWKEVLCGENAGAREFTSCRLGGCAVGKARDAPVGVPSHSTGGTPPPRSGWL